MVELHLGSLRITSPDFEPEGPISDRHAADGGNASPELVFANVPSGAESLALICHDPDAPATHGFDHWVVYDLPPDTQRLARGGPVTATEGTNSNGETGYTGPAPPPGHGLHHYYFHLYALDTELGAEHGLSRRQLLDLLDDHIVEQARLVGTYELPEA